MCSVGKSTYSTYFSNVFSIHHSAYDLTKHGSFVAISLNCIDKISSDLHSINLQINLLDMK